MWAKPLFSVENVLTFLRHKFFSFLLRQLSNSESIETNHSKIPNLLVLLVLFPCLFDYLSIDIHLSCIPMAICL